MTDIEKSPIYRIIFIQHEKIYEIYSRFLTEESLMGFIEIEELVFQEMKSSVLVDPLAEKLQAEFNGVRRCYIPLHTILRIDEVVSEGRARVIDAEQTDKSNNVSRLPLNK